MSEKNESNVENPLLLIFKKSDKGEILEELNSIKNIPLFFNYLSNKNVSQEDKIKVMEKFTKIIKENRYLIEYFSAHNNKSIYIFLFELVGQMID